MRPIRFWSDGQLINEADTPVQLELKDEDMTDMLQQQMGYLLNTEPAASLQNIPTDQEFILH